MCMENTILFYAWSDFVYLDVFVFAISRVEINIKISVKIL